jgi:hypothetical protein
MRFKRDTGHHGLRCRFEVALLIDCLPVNLSVSMWRSHVDHLAVAVDAGADQVSSIRLMAGGHEFTKDGMDADTAPYGIWHRKNDEADEPYGPNFYIFFKRTQAHLRIDQDAQGVVVVFCDK